MRYYSFSAEQGNLDYYFIYGPQINQVIETYTRLTGRPYLPPKWSLGYQQCRWSYYPDTEVLRLAETFRENDIPADVIYLDIHYMDEYKIFTWDPDRFPNPANLLKQLSDMGFKVVVIIDPGVKADSNFAVAAEGIKNDYFLKYPDGQVYIGEVWPGPSYFPDFSRPQVRDWWGTLLGDLLDTGVSGFWNDMNEPAVWGKAFPLEVLFYDDGNISSQKKMHNLYGLLMSQAAYDGYRKAKPNKRPFLLTRAGFAGEQRYTAVWTGDNLASEEHLELGIRMMIGAGISGIPYIGTDVGGFGKSPPAELFTRWLQVGIFSPLFRNHTHYNTKDQEPWTFGEDFEAINRQTISKRYQMLPYLYSLFWEAYESGSPILRPLFWHYQNDSIAYLNEFQHQFLVGEKLLVAPVTKTGHYLKKVYLPQGKWLDLNSEKMYEGPNSIIIDASLYQIPMFLNQGAILPSQETIQYVGEKSGNVLNIDIFAEIQYNRFLLYEDDGQSFDYLQEAYRLTEFEIEQKKNKITFTKNSIIRGYQLTDRKLKLKFHSIPKLPEEVLVGNKKLSQTKSELPKTGFFYDSRNKLLTLEIPDEETKQTVVIIGK
jgi:alpha-glucosidase